jgi:HTTM domain
VSVRSLVRTWNEFFFTPQSPAPIALFRIVYGLLVIAQLILLRPDWFTWYGTRGMVTLRTMQQMEPGVRINLFAVMPQNDAWVEGLFWVFLCAAVLLTVGCLTRAASIVVFLCLASIHERSLYILNAGDTILRVNGFFLMFAPAGAAFSVDRLLRIRRGKEGAEIQPRPPWAQRMIQFQTALAYLVTFYYKTQGAAWINGTALYYVYQLHEFQRFPVPGFFHSPLMIRMETWGTLAVEFALGALVWIKEWRYPILLLGVVLHLSVEYAMNVPLFQWIMLSTYITFIYPEDLEGVWKRVNARWRWW